MDDGRQTGRAAVAQADQLRLVRRMVFLLQGEQRVEPCGELRQPFGVRVDPLAVGCGRCADVLQLFERRTQPGGILRSGGVVFADMGQGGLRVFQLHQHARLVGVEGVAQRREGLADTVGVLQHGQLLLDFGLLSGAEVRGRQLLGLETEPLLVAPPLFGGFAQGGRLAAQLLQAGVLRRVFAQQLSVAGHGVERRGAELLRREDEVLVLRVDVQQAGPDLAQLRERYGYVIDERPALARRGDDACQGGFRGVFEVVLSEELLQFRPCEGECPFDRATACGVLHGRAVVLDAQQQPEGAEQNRLSGAGLARDDVQVRVQFQFELVDKRVVFDRQTT